MAEQEGHEALPEDYQAVEVVAEGPLGRLYRARHRQSGAARLLKVCSPMAAGAAATERYARDRWKLAREIPLHFNILQLLQVGMSGGRPYAAFEDVSGRRLCDSVRDAAMEVRDALDVVSQACEALRAAHRRNLVHGHLKPSDILLSTDSAGRRLVKVAFYDLGVKDEESVSVLPGGVVGAPRSMAPELIRGAPPTVQSDVFALGVVAYRLLTGVEPFSSESELGYLLAIPSQQVRPADEVNESVPHEVALVVARMLRKDPRRRYQNVQRVIDDLERCVQSIETGKLQTAPYGTDSAFARRYTVAEAGRSTGSRTARRLAWAALALGAVAVAGWVGFQTGRRGLSAPVPPGAAVPAPEPAAPAAPPPAQPPQAQPAAGPRLTSPEREFQVAMAQAERCTQKGDYEAALTVFRDLGRSYADNSPMAARCNDQIARIQSEWAYSLSQQGQHEAAVQHYAAAMQLAPQDSEFGRLARRRMPAAMVEWAEQLRSTGRYMEALHIYEQVAKDYPDTKEGRLLPARKPELLLGQATVLWKDQQRLSDALAMMLDLLNEHPNSEAAARARKALPQLYLDAARENLKRGQFEQVRKQLRELVEAYPDDPAAKQAADLDAETLFGQLKEAMQAGNRDKCTAHFVELLRLYPTSAWTVKAAQARLDLEPGPNEILYDDNTARDQLAKAMTYRDGFEYRKAIAALKGIIRSARPDSPIAARALAALPEFMYESALFDYGSNSRAECDETLNQLASQFAGTAWEEKVKATRQRIQDAPEGMVYVPEGRFQMGTDMSELVAMIRKEQLTPLGDEQEARVFAEASGLVNETPKHVASTGPFYIDATEVTNEQYKKYIDATGNPPPAHWRNRTYPEGTGKLPVVNITLAEAKAYARWRGDRLPTELEWEKAARGTDGRDFPWRGPFSKEKCHHMRAEDVGPAPVGSYPLGKSPYGCLDMIGNVMEWTASAFSPYPGSKAPASQQNAGRQVVRGGAWYQQEIAPIPSRCASRYPMDPTQANMATGFRCVKDVTEAAEPSPSEAASGRKS